MTDEPATPVPDQPAPDTDPLRPRHSLLDRWWIVLGATLLLALIPAAFTLLSRDRDPANPAAPVPSLPVSVAPPGTAGSTARAASFPGAADVTSRSPRPSGSPKPRTSAPVPAPTPAGPSATRSPAGPASLTVRATTPLFAGQSLRTFGTVLTMRADGDLVVTDAIGRRLWHTGTDDPRPDRAGYQATFQDDGNFVVYTRAQQPLWTSGTAGHPGAVLVLQADGDVCVVDRGRQLWCAGTRH